MHSFIFYLPFGGIWIILILSAISNILMYEFTYFFLNMMVIF